MSARTPARVWEQQAAHADWVRNTLDTAAAQQRALSHAAMAAEQQTQRVAQATVTRSVPINEAALHKAVATGMRADRVVKGTAGVGDSYYRMDEGEYDEATEYARIAGILNRELISKKAVDEYKSGVEVDYEAEIARLRAKIDSMWRMFNDGQKARMMNYAPNKFD